MNNEIIEMFSELFTCGFFSIHAEMIGRRRWSIFFAATVLVVFIKMAYTLK